MNSILKIFPLIMLKIVFFQLLFVSFISRDVSTSRATNEPAPLKVETVQEINDVKQVSDKGTMPIHNFHFVVEI